MNTKKISIIGAASGWGALNRTTEDGPHALRTFGLLEKLRAGYHDIEWSENLYPLRKASEFKNPSEDEIQSFVVDLDTNLLGSVSQCLKQDKFPFIIGGDHSVAVGTWSALAYPLAAEKNFGLIWVDAHMDAHTIETTPSRAIHGMPLACLLGHGTPDLTNLGYKVAKLLPKHVVVIGVRSYEKEEAALLEKLGVRIFMMPEIQSRGFASVLDEALTIVTENTKGFGVSIDLDGFDPLDAPGVGSPAPNGLRAKKVLPHLSEIRNNSKFCALEIAEFNPHLDKDFKTAQLTCDLADALLPLRQS